MSYASPAIVLRSTNYGFSYGLTESQPTPAELANTAVSGGDEFHNFS
jgi:hypothetical protein